MICHDLLKSISIWGGICSLLIGIVGLVLLLRFLKSDKYEGKLVRETPLLKYTIVKCTGLILSIVFNIILFILELSERT
jgi:hypothetical protein